MTVDSYRLPSERPARTPDPVSATPGPHAAFRSRRRRPPQPPGGAGHPPCRRRRAPAGGPGGASHSRGRGQRDRRRGGGRHLSRRRPSRHRELRGRGPDHGLRRAAPRGDHDLGARRLAARGRAWSSSGTTAVATCPRGSSAPSSRRRPTPGSPRSSGSARSGFAEVAQPAIECARDGFPLGPFVARIIGENEAAYRRWPTSAPIFLPGGQAPRAGQRFVQADLGRTLTYLADEDRAGQPRRPRRRARRRARRVLPRRRRRHHRALPRRGGRAPDAGRPRRLPGAASSRPCGPRSDRARW